MQDLLRMSFCTGSVSGFDECAASVFCPEVSN